MAATFAHGAEPRVRRRRVGRHRGWRRPRAWQASQSARRRGADDRLAEQCRPRHPCALYAAHAPRRQRLGPHPLRARPETGRRRRGAARARRLVAMGSLRLQNGVPDAAGMAGLDGRDLLQAARVSHLRFRDAAARSRFHRAIGPHAGAGRPRADGNPGDAPSAARRRLAAAIAAAAPPGRRAAGTGRHGKTSGPVPGISRNTVHEYVRRLHAQFGASSRGQLLTQLARQLHSLEASGARQSADCWYFRQAAS